MNNTIWWDNKAIGEARAKFGEKQPNWKNWVRPTKHPIDDSGFFPSGALEKNIIWARSNPDKSYYVPVLIDMRANFGNYVIFSNDREVNLPSYRGWITKIIRSENTSGRCMSPCPMLHSCPQQIPEAFLPHMYTIDPEFVKIIGWEQSKEILSIPEDTMPMFRLVGKL